MRRIVYLIAVAVVAASCVTPTSSGGLGADCTSPPSLAAGSSLFGCNLSGLDMSGLDLTGADLRGAILVGANLIEANLTNANLEGANLTNANLEGANLTGAILSGAILLGAYFLLANLTGAQFDFGRAFGSDGSGGGQPTGAGCTGDYCPGYNAATVDTGDPLCDPELASQGFFVHRTEEDLAAAGQRSVVTDSNTNFSGALFDNSNSPAPRFQTRALPLGTAYFSGATFINVEIACKIADGARFPGATFRGTGYGGNATHMYHLSFLNSVFTASTFQGVVFSDVTFAGSSFTGSTWSDVSLEVPDIFPIEMNEPLPYFLLNLDHTNFSNARIGIVPNPYTGGTAVTLGGTFAGLFRTTNWANSTFFRAKISNLTIPGGDLSSTSTRFAEVTAPGEFANATLLNGWAQSTWSGSFGWEGTTCPDGTIGSSATPCF